MCMCVCVVCMCVCVCVRVCVRAVGVNAYERRDIHRADAEQESCPKMY